MVRTVAKAFIFDADGNVLILRRSETHPTHAFHPDLPGGEVEENEVIAAAVAREVAEEAGITVVPEALTHVNEHVDAEGYHQVRYTLRLAEQKPSITISWEHDRSEWLPVHEVVARGLPTNVDSYYEMAFTYLRENHS